MNSDPKGYQILHQNSMKSSFENFGGLYPIPYMVDGCSYFIAKQKFNDVFQIPSLLPSYPLV